jgi:hypothetical protein
MWPKSADRLMMKRMEAEAPAPGPATAQKLKLLPVKGAISGSSTADVHQALGEHAAGLGTIRN